MQLSQERNILSEFFFGFSKFRFNFENFQKRWPSQPMYFGSYGLRKTWLDKCKKKSGFGEPLEKWHGKRAETLFKSERQHFYHIY